MSKVLNTAVEVLIEVRLRNDSPTTLTLNYGDPDDRESLASIFDLLNGRKSLDDLSEEDMEALIDVGLIIARTELPAANASADNASPTGCEYSAGEVTEYAVSKMRRKANESDWFAEHHKALGMPPVESGHLAAVEIPGCEIVVPVPTGSSVETWDIHRDFSALSTEEINHYAPAGIVFPAQPPPSNYVADAGASLQKQGFVKLRNLITPMLAKQLHSYVLSLRQEGFMTLADGQVDKRWWFHREPLMDALHKELNSIISRVVIEAGLQATRASYSYLSLYERGSVLERHKDRPQCRWNVSIPFGQTPNGSSPWPIYMKLDSGVASVELAPGDGVLYSGSEVEHWRDRFEQADDTSVCFFHFVDADFDGTLD